MFDAAVDAGITAVQFDDGSGNKAYDITTKGGRSKYLRQLIVKD